MTYARPRLDVDEPGSLARHDAALRTFGLAARQAIGQGATDKALAEWLVRAVKSLDLLGPRSSLVAALIAYALDNELDEVDRLTALIRSYDEARARR